MIDRTPAFPQPLEHEIPGMELRDYFAAAALQGILAKTFGENMIADVCSKSYEYADAMMEERKAKI